MSKAHPTRLFVISDLHLGGAPAVGDKPAFQMCTESGRRRLAAFLRWVARQHTTELDVHLVIGGDIVDFLAEEQGGGFQPFTADDRLAKCKLSAILADTAEVWKELRALVETGAAVTLMLGNHDIELSLPGPRRLLHDTLGPGRVEFIYDNQAFTFGKVLVEHGNRYDDWNAVPHDDLREVRSRLSRGESPEFDPLPGSRMVVELVNPLKEKLAFVDLLKPEDAALLPFLALLAPNRYKQISTTLKNRIRALRVRYGPGRQPKDRNYIGAEHASGTAAEPLVALGTGDAVDDDLLQLADAAAAGGDPAMASSEGSFLDRWKAKLAGAYRERQLDLLHKVLRAYRGAHERAFDIEYEEEKYLQAATETAARGYDVVVYGHTHLPKCVPLSKRRPHTGEAIGRDAFYFNSGTWADLMAVPRDLLAPAGSAQAAAARQALKAFADDLAANRVEAWRRQLPTFVKVDLDAEGKVQTATLEMFGDEDSTVLVTTELVRERLYGK